MLSTVEFSKLVSRTTTHVLDPILIGKYHQIQDPSSFWQCVKELLPKSVQYLGDLHPVNINMFALSQDNVIPPRVYDYFLNQPNAVMVPFLAQTLPDDQKITVDFLGPILERFDANNDLHQWRKNMLLAGQLSLKKQWGKSYTQEHVSFSYVALTDMWKETYTHLPEEILFQSSDKCVQFFLSLNEVFPIVQQRFPESLGKLMNLAIHDCVNTIPSWEGENHLKEWGGLLDQLSAQHWRDVTLPKKQYAKDIVEAFMLPCVQKHTILEQLVSIAEESPSSKRKI